VGYFFFGQKRVLALEQLDDAFVRLEYVLPANSPLLS